MADTKHVVLIHGSWGRGEQLAPARAAFEERGYTAHTPTLRHHELPLHEGAMKIASLSLRDYTDDLVAFVNSLDSPPLLIGHSMGGLLAQLVAARTRQAGLVAACPAPAAGILACDPHKLAHDPAALVTATSLDQAVAPSRRSSNFDAGSPTRRPRTSPGRYMTVWSANPGAMSGSCSLRCQGFRRPPLSISRRSPPRCWRSGPSATASCQPESCAEPRPGTSTAPPLRFPAPTTWCFQGRLYRSR